MSVQPMELETMIHLIPAHAPIPNLNAPIQASPDFIPWTTVQQKQKHWCTVCVQEGRDGYECPGERDRGKCKFLQVSIQFYVNTFLMLTQIDRTIIPKRKVGHNKNMHINYFLYYMTMIYAVLRGSSEKNQWQLPDLNPGFQIK